jgi:hypothetical protein
MRNYWVKIAFGAAAIFALGMIGITIVRQGIARVHTVVEGTGPIHIPLSFIPFNLEGERLGSLERVTLHRSAPRQVTQVDLEVKLSDSLLVQGMAGCRLAANLDDDAQEPGVNIERGRFAKGTFWCIHDLDSTEHVEYGQATFRPGEVRVPLYLTHDLVEELQQLDFDHDPDPNLEVEAESIAAAAEASADSAVRSAERRMRTVDSLRTEGIRRADSTRRASTPAARADSGR